MPKNKLPTFDNPWGNLPYPNIRTPLQHRGPSNYPRPPQPNLEKIKPLVTPRPGRPFKPKSPYGVK